MKTHLPLARSTANPSAWREAASWAESGLIAGLALVALILGLRLLMGVPSQPEILQDRLLFLLPGGLISLLVDRLQFWGKPLLLVFWAVGQTLACGLIGAGFGRFVAGPGSRLKRPRLLAAGGAAGLLFWMAIELLLMPLLGLGPLGARAQGGLPSAGWSALAYLAFGLLLTGFHPLVSASTAAEARSSEEAPRASRRAVLRIVVPAAAASLAGFTIWQIARSIGERDTLPLATATAGGGTGPAASALPAGVSSEITPNERFYVVSKNIVDPNLSSSGWSLEVSGLVRSPLRLSYEDVHALPPTDLYATLECISNEVGGKLISNTRWTGVPLAGLLDQAVVQDGASWVVFTSADGYQESAALERLRQAPTLLAYNMNGSPLPSKHGFPLRLVTTGRYGMKNPKWLNRIELAAKPPVGYWEHAGWNAENGVQTMVRFDSPPQHVGAGSTVLLGGVAFAGDRGVSRVEVSVNGGATWSPARITAPLSPFTWSLWSFPWQVQRAGSCTLLVRGVDGKGTVQTEQRHDPYPTGATGYHTIRVEAS